MKMCEYTHNLFDMGLLVYLAEKNREIVFGQLMYDYYYILNVDFSRFYYLYISLYNTIDFNTTHGKKTVVKFMKLSVSKNNLEADIRRIHGILPYMSISW